ncbi:TetR/AcrR family transcriptional regulator [Streptomonospora sediminis]
MSDEKKHEARERILEAAGDLLAEQGAEGLSTRAVSAAAGVQVPTLYRLFTDKQGLLDALARRGFERYLHDKRGMAPTGDPVADLRQGWDLHVEFGLANPALYTLMYGTARPGHRPPAAQDAEAFLVGLLEAVAAAGRLRVPVADAAQLVGAAGMGVTLSLIQRPPERRSPDLAPRTRETVLAAITTSEPAATGDGDGGGHPAGPGTVATRALALDSVLGESSGALSPAESALLREWLNRLAACEQRVRTE